MTTHDMEANLLIALEQHQRQSGNMFPVEQKARAARLMAAHTRALSQHLAQRLVFLQKQALDEEASATMVVLNSHQLSSQQVLERTARHIWIGGEDTSSNHHVDLTFCGRHSSKI